VAASLADRDTTMFLKMAQQRPPLHFNSNSAVSA
jgi:hypothetical protein